VHPFAEKLIAPVSVLIADLENPEDSLHASLDVLVRHAGAVAAPNLKPNLRLWHQPGGIDLRSREGRAQLETVISERRPDLVVLGPLYKAYSIRASEGYELPAREAQQVLDDLRTHYRFALLIEDHAPQAAGGSKRDWRPYGSSLWLRWPEVGIGLNPVDNKGQTLQLTRWRGDRSKTVWPRQISRSESGWPWSVQQAQPLGAMEVAA
jgi:replicative DNA helicase